MNNRSQKPYDSLLKWTIDSQKPYYCNVNRIFGCFGLDLSLLYKLQMIWPRLKISLSLTFGKETLHKGRRKWGGSYWTLDAWRQNGKLFSQNRPKHQRRSRHWSVVSCVRCGCVGAGLGFPVGDSRFAPVFHPQPPIQNHWNSLSFINILKFDIKWKHKNGWNSNGFINMSVWDEIRGLEKTL